jgi:hypothetical protein
VTALTWPSRQTRRSLRHGFWRHRRGIRALLTGVTVLCSLQVLAGRTPSGEPSSSLSMTGGAAATAAPTDDGLVTTVVRFADPGTALLVTAGSVVDVLATPATSVDPVAVATTGTGAGAAAADTPLADVVASGVRVVRVPSEPGAATAEGALLVLAVSPTTARLLAAAASERLSLVVRPGATAG